MGFNVGLLEMIGYLVPGATVTGAWLWLTGRLPLDRQPEMSDTAGLGIALLASYVVGHLLTILSSALRDNAADNPYGNTPPFQDAFARTFGDKVSDRAVYHLARALVLHRSERLGERVERYFALTILSRNLTAAAVAVAGMLVWFGHWGWAVAWVATAGAFLLQYRRFMGTERRAVFGAAAVLLAARD